MNDKIHATQEDLLDPKAEQFKSIGSWFRKMRGEMTPEELASRSSVPVVTISRIENGTNEVTLNTAIRLCNGMDISPNEVLMGLRNRPLTILQNQTAGILDNGTHLKIMDLQRFGDFYKSNPQNGNELLVTLMNGLYRDIKDAIPYQADEIGKLLIPPDELPWLNYQVVTPDRSTDDIVQMYQNDEVITRGELTSYLSDVSKKNILLSTDKKSSTQTKPTVDSKIFLDFWNRNRTKSEGWAIKLDDLFSIDDFLTGSGMSSSGEILALWWSNEYFNALLFRPYIEPALKSGRRSGFDNPPWNYETARATLLVQKLYIWYQFFRAENEFARLFLQTVNPGGVKEI